MRTSTAAGTVLGALVTAMRARTGYRSPWADATGTPVYHSAEAGMHNPGRLPLLIVLGDTGDPEAATEAAQTGQRPATLGTLHSRQEDLTVHVRIVAQTGETGDGVVQAQWDAAEGLLDDLHAVLSADPSLGLAGGGPSSYRSVVARLDGVPAVLAYQRGGTAVELLADVAVEVRL